MKATRPRTPITLECSQEEAQLIATLLYVIDSHDSVLGSTMESMFRELESVGISADKNASLRQGQYNTFYLTYKIGTM